MVNQTPSIKSNNLSSNRLTFDLKYTVIISFTVVSILCLLCLIFASEKLGTILGMFIGTTVIILNLHLLYLTVNKALRFSEPRKATFIILSSFVIRYFFVGLIIYLIILTQKINLIFFAIGTMVPLSAFTIDRLKGGFLGTQSTISS